MSLSPFIPIEPTLVIREAVAAHLKAGDLEIHIPPEMIDRFRMQVATALVESLERPETNRALVFFTLGALGHEALPALYAQLANPRLDVYDQKELVLSMGRWSDSLSVLLEIAKDDHYPIEVRLEANSAAGELLWREKEFQELASPKVVTAGDEDVDNEMDPRDDEESD